MTKDKLPVYLSNAGELLVIIGAATWLTQSDIPTYIFALGAIILTIGRLMEKHPEGASTTLRRLYRQRNVGTVVLLIAAILMFTHQYIDGKEIGNYTIKATPSAWLLPFAIFAAIELYTAFRIPTQQNKEQQKA